VAKKWKIYCLVLICLLTELFSRSHPAIAQSILVAINPTRIEFTASPGQRLAGSFKFWNGTDSLLPVHLEATDYSAQDEAGHVLVEGEEDRANSLKDWVHPEYPDLTVFPKQEITLDFSIDVPANADPGSHWGALLVVTVPASSGNGAAIQTRTALLLLVKVLGDVREQMTLESLSLPSFADSPPISIEARFRNEGTVHEAPSGDIEVRNMLGWPVATSTLPLRNVLPGAVRKVEASVGDGLWLGRYTVSLHAKYGDSGQELASTQHVWVVPWRTQGWKALLAILLIAFVVWKRRNFGSAWYFLRTGSPPPQDL
jgi:hypothetical protein